MAGEVWGYFNVNGAALLYFFRKVFRMLPKPKKHVVQKKEVKLPLAFCGGKIDHKSCLYTRLWMVVRAIIVVLIIHSHVKKKGPHTKVLDRFQGWNGKMGHNRKRRWNGLVWGRVICPKVNHFFHTMTLLW